MMPSWCQGICRTLNMDSTFAGMPATPFTMWVDQVGCFGVLLRRCPAPGAQARPWRGAWSGSGAGMLAGRLVVDEQGRDNRQQMPTTGAASQPGGLVDVGLGVRGADAGDGHARGLGQVGQP